MSGSIRDFLKIAGIAIVTLTLLGALFFGLNKATGFLDKVWGNFDDMTVALDESDFTKYEDMTVSGSDVISAIKSFENTNEKINVVVALASGTTTEYCYTTDLTTKTGNKVASATTRGVANYINPGGQFLGSITRDSNDTIVTLTFTQQSSTTTP